MKRVPNLGRSVSAVLLGLAAYAFGAVADEPSGLPALNHLMLVYREAADFERARHYAERALEIVKAQNLTETAEGATVLGNLGAIAEMEGETADAKKWLGRALAIREGLLGLDHPLVAENLSDLALAYSMEGRFDTARGLYQRALTILGARPDAKGTLAGVLNNLGKLEGREGHLKEAENILRRSVRESERVFGGQHPNTAAGLVSLAEVLRLRHRYSEASEALRRAEGINRASFGTEHPRIARDLSLEGALAFDRKRYSQAEAALQRALGILERSLPQSHREIGQAQASLALVYLREKRLADAESAYRRALLILEQAEGCENPGLLPVMQQYSEVLRARQDFAGAAGLDARAMKIRVERTLRGAA